MSSAKHCPKCRREAWDGGGAISVDVCVKTDGDTCALVVNQNSLIAALKSVIRSVVITTENKLIVRTALAVVEHVTPSSRACPKCAKPLVVGQRNVISVHHASNADQRPCPASYGTVLGGFLLEKEP